MSFSGVRIFLRELSNYVYFLKNAAKKKKKKILVSNELQKNQGYAQVPSCAK